MSEDASGIDPRYPAEFQRGGSTSRGRLGTGARSGQRDDTGPRVPDEPSSASATTRERDEQARSAPAADERSGAHARPDIEEQERRGVNPFLVTLWVLAPAMVIGGVAAFRMAANSSMRGYILDSPEALDAQVFIQTLYTLAPSLVSAGFIGILGLLFWHAHAWRRRRTTLR